MKKAWSIISSVLVALVVLLAIALVGVRLFGLQVYTVLSGSMEPVSYTHLDVYKRQARLNGRTHYMIVVAEGVGNTAEIVQQIKEKMGIEVRLTVLGHIQRGGSPTVRDRLIATQMGYHAVALLAEGKTNRIVCCKSCLLYTSRCV